MATRKKNSKKVAAKRPAKKKSAVKKPSAKAGLKLKKKTAVKKKVAAKKPPAKKRVIRRSSPGKDTGVIERRRVSARPGGQSGDLQGLSNVEDADSESVDELLEEGNAFEAGIVKGVEDVPYADEDEVHTLEVSEDDVPEEYLEDED